MRKAYLRYLLILWAAFLLLGLSLSLGVEAWWRWLPAVCGLVLLLCLGWLWYRHVEEDMQVLTKGEPEQVVTGTPIILVVGPYAKSLFARSGVAASVRQEQGALWLLAATPAELRPLLGRLGKDGNVLYAAILPFLPDGHVDGMAMRQQFVQWRKLLADEGGLDEVELPCYLTIYAQLAGQSGVYQADTASWHGDEFNLLHPVTTDLKRSTQSLRKQLQLARVEQTDVATIKRAALGKSLLDWLTDQSILSSVSPILSTAPFAPAGVLLADVNHAAVDLGAWSRWLTEKTNLQPNPTGSAAAPLPLPILAKIDPPSLAKRLSTGRVGRTFAYAMALTVLTVGLSVSVAGWRNRVLLEELGSHLAAYAQIDNLQQEAKVNALRQLERDRERLLHDAQVGRSGLDWGLYRGYELLPNLTQMIDSYVAPKPDSVTVDAVMLFAPGKSVLLPGADQSLQQILDLILSNSEMNVLIAGHTDDLGDSARNIELSVARALAVRDWLMRKAKLPVTRFAIQGYGDTRPLASNADEVGRATNRRVEVMLIRPKEK
ncbi:OmpA family protein [Neisseriaceae bacterium TC5R-5]|nr:OmpA family protein [Neisseriaceae bacterium TC5R-5]